MLLLRPVFVYLVLNTLEENVSKSHLAQPTHTTTVSLVFVTLASNYKMDNVFPLMLFSLHVLPMPTSMVFPALAMLDSIKLQSMDVLLALLEPHGMVILVELNQPELVLMDISSTPTPINVNLQLLHAEIMPIGTEPAVFVSLDLT